MTSGLFRRTGRSAVLALLWLLLQPAPERLPQRLAWLRARLDF